MEHEQYSGKVLLVVDDPARAEALLQALGSEVTTQIIDDLQVLFKTAARTRPLLVVIDTAEETGLHVCCSLQEDEATTHIPILLLCDQERSAVQGLESGAADCLHRRANPELFRAKVRKLIQHKLIHDGLKESVTLAKRRTSELEQLIHMVVHDLKSPVVAIEGFVKLLKDRYSDQRPDPTRDEILYYLTRAGASIRELLEDLTQLFGTEKSRPQWANVCLAETVQEVVSQNRHVIEDKKIEIHLDVDTCHVTVIGDERRIRQVLENLILNAVNHMGNPPDARIEIRLRCDHDFATLSVSDNGVGIPEQYREKIFSRFFRVPGNDAKAGTGLGLSIVKTIIEGHGGRIWLETGTERGTTFSFTLPTSVCRNTQESSAFPDSPGTLGTIP